MESQDSAIAPTSPVEIAIPDTIAGFRWLSRPTHDPSIDPTSLHTTTPPQEVPYKRTVIKETVFKVLLPSSTIGITDANKILAYRPNKHLTIRDTPRSPIYIKDREKSSKPTLPPFVEQHWQNRLLTRVFGAILLGGSIFTGGLATAHAIDLHRIEATVEGTRMPGMVDETKTKIVIEQRNAILNMDALGENKEWYAAPAEYARSPITSNGFLAILLASCGGALFQLAGQRENERTHAYDTLQSILDDAEPITIDSYYKGLPTNESE